MVELGLGLMFDQETVVPVVEKWITWSWWSDVVGSMIRTTPNVDTAAYRRAPSESQQPSLSKVNN